MMKQTRPSTTRRFSLLLLILESLATLVLLPFVRAMLNVDRGLEPLPISQEQVPLRQSHCVRSTRLGRAVWPAQRYTATGRGAFKRPHPGPDSPDLRSSTAGRR